MPWYAVAASLCCVCNRICISCTGVSQARPHKSIDTQFVPREGRSSVNPNRITSLTAGAWPAADAVAMKLWWAEWLDWIWGASPETQTKHATLVVLYELVS